jgi:hypothetical protein
MWTLQKSIAETSYIKSLPGIGKTQREILKCVLDHGCWYSGCGWLWTSYHETERLMESLAKRGLLVATTLETGKACEYTRYDPVVSFDKDGKINESRPTPKAEGA